MKTRIVVIVTALSWTLGTALAADAGEVERVHYKWSLRGALAWVARIALPTSGRGTLETSGDEQVVSRLQMTDGRGESTIYYESRMTSGGEKTLASVDGFSWRDRDQQQRVVYDYGQNVARVDKQTDDVMEQKLRPLGAEAPRDVLTCIYYLRQHLDEFADARNAEIYSGGKPYRFLITPRPATTMKFGGQQVRVLPFTVAPLDKGKGGGVRVWFSDDDKHTPLQIEIDQKYATLKLSALNN